MAKYTLAEKVFGPRLTDDEIMSIEIRAMSEGWYDVLEVMLEGRKTNRAKRFLLAYLRDGLIEVVVYDIELRIEEDVYEDSDPFEGMGER